MTGADPRARAKTVTKAVVVEGVREQTGLTWEDSTQLVETVLEVMKHTLAAGESVKISGFGTFVVAQKAARRGRNPQTSERILISKRRVLTFKPSLTLRQGLQAPVEA